MVRDIAPADANDGVDTLSGIEQVRFGGGSQLTVSGNEFQVNTTTAGNQTAPTITSLADGGYLIGWTAPDGDGTGVFAQRYDVAGNAVGLSLTGTAAGETLKVGEGQTLTVDGAGGNDIRNDSDFSMQPYARVACRRPGLPHRGKPCSGGDLPQWRHLHRL